MPVTIGQLTAHTALASFTVMIKVEDEETGEEHTAEYRVILFFYPTRVTEKTIGLAQSFSATGNDADSVTAGFKAFNEELVRLIKWWDVMENDGVTMFPLDARRLSELSIEFRGQLLVAVVSDIRPETLAPHLNGHS